MTGETNVGITPPLRVWLPEGKARRGSRAFFAKADAVGGKMRFIAIPNYTPHRFACGLAPLAHRLPLKGGVNPLSSDFFNSPLKGGVNLKPDQRGRAIDR